MGYLNYHQVGEMMADMTSLLQTKEVGLAVRPTVALLNHSCCPNTVRASLGSQVKDTYCGFLNCPFTCPANRTRPRLLLIK